MGAGTMTTLTEEDACAIQKECPAVAFVSPGARSGGQVIAGNLNWVTSIEGTGADYLEIRKWAVEYGEFYSDQDVKAAAKVCVLGKTVADDSLPRVDSRGPERPHPQRPIQGRGRAVEERAERDGAGSGRHYPGAVHHRAASSVPFPVPAADPRFRDQPGQHRRRADTDHRVAQNAAQDRAVRRRTISRSGTRPIWQRPPQRRQRS